MEPFGIYTLGNDIVYDQLVALLNSIEANISPDIPICIIPFDHRLDRVKEEIASRPNVTLFQDQASIDRWEAFALQFVTAHLEEQQAEQSHPRWYGGKLHRKFSAFDGPFEKFVFFDADSLAMKPIADVFNKLDTYDFVFDDWEHAKPQERSALNIPLIEAKSPLTEQELRPKLHCSSFFGAKRGFFDAKEINALQDSLVNKGEAAWVNTQGWWDDAFLFNYMTLKFGRSLFNYTLSPDGQDRTGNCANSDPFTEVDQVLYNQNGLKPIHRIHYMGYSSTDFTRLAQGEDADVCYKDIFLHYRFIHQPDQKPATLKPPSLMTKINRFSQRAAKKLSKVPSSNTV